MNYLYCIVKSREKRRESRRGGIIYTELVKRREKIREERRRESRR